MIIVPHPTAVDRMRMDKLTTVLRSLAQRKTFRARRGAQCRLLEEKATRDHKSPLYICGERDTDGILWRIVPRRSSA